MKEPNIAELLERWYFDTWEASSVSSLTLTALIINLNIIHMLKCSNFSVLGPACLLARDWGWGLIPFERKKNFFFSPNRLMILAFPFLKLIKSIFPQHNAHLKHHQITLRIHIENVF